MEQPAVRRYQSSDLDAVKNLHRIGLEANGSYIGSGPWEKDLDTIEATYFDGGDFFVGYLGERLVVMGALQKVDEITAELRRMRVQPDAQRRGYGQMMLDVLEQRARELGYKKIVLDSGVKNIGAHAFYQKNGYHETRRERKPYLPFDSIYYEKDLV
jgi:GNAT superfamily N-acetyltransferase